VPLPALALLLALQTPAASTQDGADLFSRSKCALCHGEDGKGKTNKGKKLQVPDLSTEKWNKETTDKEILETISDGTKDKKGNVRMPAFKSKLTPEEIQTLAAYVRTFVHK
jgi:mono/diheme cytochrome c family protein